MIVFCAFCSISCCLIDEAIVIEIGGDTAIAVV